MSQVPILNLSSAPKDPIERIIWLDGVADAVRRELYEAYSEAYFNARLQRRFDTALEVGKTSRKRALAMTRRHNERTGRSVRWADRLDPTSTAFTRAK